MKHTPENVLKVIKSMRANAVGCWAECDGRGDTENVWHFKTVYVALDQVVMLFENEDFFHAIARIHKLEEDENGEEVRE